MGIGNAVGPLFGSVLYKYCGFDCAFFSFGSFVIIVALYAHLTQKDTPEVSPIKQE